jgi:hypothetical protein
MLPVRAAERWERGTDRTVTPFISFVHLRPGAWGILDLILVMQTQLSLIIDDSIRVLCLRR